MKAVIKKINLNEISSLDNAVMHEVLLCHNNIHENYTVQQLEYTLQDAHKT